MKSKFQCSYIEFFRTRLYLLILVTEMAAFCDNDTVELFGWKDKALKDQDIYNLTLSEKICPPFMGQSISL